MGKSKLGGRNGWVRVDDVGGQLVYLSASRYVHRG